MYNPRSTQAETFIDHTEITSTMAYARANSANRTLIESLLAKAARCKGLSHREAAVLLECSLPDLNEQMFALARRIKEQLYGNRIVLFAPLYLSNYCVNGCVYCPYNSKNKTMPRIKMTQEEIAEQVTALQDMGHKRLAIEAGEHPANNIDYILESIHTIYGVRHQSGVIRRVNVNIAATTVDNYRKLKEAGIGTYILFQETYHRENYIKLHPTGPKHDYAYHTEAMDRAMEAGVDDVGIGVLFGLSHYLYDFTALLMHAQHLESKWGVGPHTISIPRICPADHVNPEHFTHSVADDVFRKLVALIRISVPYTGMIVSTRESQQMREEALKLGVSQISGGSRTSVKGYGASETEIPDTRTEQFDIRDRRSLDEIVGWLIDLGYIPSFCTACYASGRTGGAFMKMVKNGLIAGNCTENALNTLSEYLHHYASPATKTKGEQLTGRAKNSIYLKNNRSI